MAIYNIMSCLPKQGIEVSLLLCVLPSVPFSACERTQLVLSWTSLCTTLLWLLPMSHWVINRHVESHLETIDKHSIPH